MVNLSNLYLFTLEFHRTGYERLLTSNNMSHNLFLNTYLRTSYKEPWMKTYECVALAKLYVKEVYWITLGTFGGTALSGWENKSNTFPPEIWERIEHKPWKVPKRWDIIFYSYPKKTGHVSICHEANKIDILVCEQNSQSGNWDWKWYNQINLSIKNWYKNILGWYRLK